MKYSLGIVLILVLLSCQDNGKKEVCKESYDIASVDNVKKRQISLNIESPLRGKLIRNTDSLELKISIDEDDKSSIDSINLYIGNIKVANMQNSYSKTIVFSQWNSGINNLNCIAYYKNQQVGEQSTYVVVTAHNKPEEYIAELIKQYPHNTNSYTQGLFWFDGYIYEGTGQYGESSLQKIDLRKNDLIQSYSLPKEVFGEGIVKYKDKIYQLTWQSNIAYEYDLKTFSKLTEFRYDTEGWGITNYDDEHLVMSDGSSVLYVLDPETFSPVRQFQVVDNLGPVTYLNELELINGKIWANVYLTNSIVVINPQTGFVEKKIDLSQLVPNTYANANDNVLNGIAYNTQENKIYVTGKRWPVLYEIKIKKQ